MILHSKPWLVEADAHALREVLETGMLAQGDQTRRFESALADWLQVGEPGVAVASGSAAIVLALGALGAGPGTEVIVPSYICRKVLEAIRTAGATPVLSDMGERWMVEPRYVAPLVGGRTRAIIVPHLYGIFADVVGFRQFGVPIIEDCAQAIGPRGVHRLQGDIAIFSFHPTKLITTGEGGMALAARGELAQAMRRGRDGGTGGDLARLFAPLSDMAATLGLSQLSRLGQALDRRRVLAARYRQVLEPILPASFEGYPWESSTFFRFPLRVPGGIARFQPLFAARGIRVSNGVDALLHQLTGGRDGDYPTTMALFESTVSLPIYPALTDEEHAGCTAAAVQIFRSAAS